MPLPTSRPAHADAARPHAHADTIAVIVAVLVLAAAGIVGFAAFDSASARITGSTDNASNVFEAARIDLQVDAPEGLLFNARRLYPGLVVERCIQVALIGSADDIDIRLMGRREGTAAGLEQFVETTLTSARVQTLIARTMSPLTRFSTDASTPSGNNTGTSRPDSPSRMESPMASRQPCGLRRHSLTTTPRRPSPPTSG